ncbi:hypothetical protein MsedC_1015 [Metallosphaera sedula]|uniref:Uncharacterized protein n=2 Tax=Metallosphaera TaxID=41980 RepID=A0A0K1T1G1_9CREN|nr:hypothetical protein MsedA_1015 [Metallosphaera sedula]QCO29331.1 hypothetical protein DFR88_01500 [Metallosphaera prunae]AKV76298.1 hypothetical protein MsedB_1017 [Metallosphaera sedula]AKV78549.1 hypothetical protein MsedC_1015 [Metallosphaera sedula]AKV80794.1 hypothetical protein MsedD_1016 [Metallosphaera sedula]
MVGPGGKVRWVQGRKEWGKCEVCYAEFLKGVQHSNSLNCWKVGIPISSLKVQLDDVLVLLDELGVPWKFSFFPFPLRLMSRGVIVLYFSSREEMESVVSEISPLVERPSTMERKFFDTFVNVDWVQGINYRRACPEYDKFGDWRSWKTS